MTTTQQQPKVQMMGIKIKAKINLTADDWQLYYEILRRLGLDDDKFI